MATSTLQTTDLRQQSERSQFDQNGLVRHAFPAYRVFIYGYEVTEDVFEVDVNWNIGRAPMTCTVTLSNELDKYLYTLEDLNKIYYGNKNISAASVNFLLGTNGEAIVPRYNN